MTLPTFSLLLLLLSLLSALSFPAVAKVKLGIDVLEERQFDQLKGKRVGLITNATGIDGNGVSDVDVLRHAPGVQLVALFGPEHGVYGADWAGKYVRSTTDSRTGLPVYSLYDETRKPTPEMLKGLDVLIYDIQDIGCRSYTYISTLGLAMEAAGEVGIKFYVLDRPNPLGGNRVEGMMVDPDYRSFVAQWNIPYVYGLTPGELAYLIQGSKGWIKKKPSLTIVPMVGWNRSMSWAETGLIWIPTSPHIPTPETAYFYVATGFLGEAGGVGNGVGYTLPFQVVAHPSFDAFKITDLFSQAPFTGLLFHPISFKPFYGGFKESVMKGSQIFFTRPDAVNLTNLAATILYDVYHQPGVKMFQPDPSGDSGPDAFDKIAGGSQFRQALLRGDKPEEIVAGWQPGLKAFREARRPYLLYGDRPKTIEETARTASPVPLSAPAPAPGAETSSKPIHGDPSTNP